MNKKNLLMVVLGFCVQHIGAYTNKTYLQPRNQGLVNLPLEMTTQQECMGIGFYGQSTNGSALGKYFGANTKSMTIIAQGNLPGVTTDLNTKAGTLDIGYMLHDFANACVPDVPNLLSNAPTAISLHPEETHGGVDVVYYQDLSRVSKGCYFKINFPVEQVTHDLHLKVTQTGGPVTGNPTKANIYRYFAGKTIFGQSIHDRQAQLAAGKIAGKRSATGVADIDLALGYNFSKHVFIHGGVSLPVGNKPTGEYLFEPVYGTRHVGLGAGVGADACILGCEHHGLTVNFRANYRYLVQASERRLLGLKDKQWGHYALLASADDSDITKSVLTPAANILNRFCAVTPGSQLDVLLGLEYYKGGFMLDLGYNVYLREREKVRMQDFVAQQTYVIAAKGLDILTNQVCEVNGGAFGVNEGIADGYENSATIALPKKAYIHQADIATASAQTPAQFTNGIYIGAGYLAHAYEYPVVLGIGGKYEFAAQNSVLQVWQCWLKAGISF